MGEPLVHPNGKDKEMTEENIIPMGSLVEVIESAVLEDSGDRVHSGQKFIVDDYAPFNDDPEYYSEVYSGYDTHDSWVAAHKDNVRLLKTPEELRKRKYPTATEILKDLDLLGGMGDFEFNESEVDPEDDSIELYGETPDGLRFGVRLKVAAVFPVDF
jgi:hypothetical protein